MSSAVQTMSYQDIMRRLGGEQQFVARMLGLVEMLSEETRVSGGKSSLTVTVKMAKPKGSSLDDPMIQFETQMIPSHPKPKPHMTLLYSSEDGLHSDDPRQLPMQPRLVEHAAADVRETPAAESVVREA